MSDFTPGPWEKIKFANEYGWRVIRPSGDAELGNWMMAEHIRREEDADLIASAPKMKELLREFVAIADEWKTVRMGESPLDLYERRAAAEAVARRLLTP